MTDTTNAEIDALIEKLRCPVGQSLYESVMDMLDGIEESSAMPRALREQCDVSPEDDAT